MQVQRRDGAAALVLLHLEVQSQYDPRFHQRMFRYYARLYDRYTMPIVSLAGVPTAVGRGDESPTWQPSTFEQGIWDCDLHFRWPIFKVATTDQSSLERDDNPCALVMLAHRIAQQTRRDPQRRAAAKFGLLRDLYRRGYPEEEITRRYVIVDWLLRLPEVLEQATWQQIKALKEEQAMQYVSSAERFSRAEGLEQGLVEGRVEGLLNGIRVLLGVKFGEDGRTILSELETLSEPARLQAILEGIADARTLDEVRALYATEAG